MNVELITYTPNPEAFVGYIARVSNPENQDNPDYAKLIKYLIRNNHWSPFEHSYFTFKITTSRAIAAQMLRHRSFTFQEFSQRYSEATEIEPIELRKQAIKNRQSSEEVFNPVISEFYDRAGFADHTYADEVLADHIYDTKDLYKKLLSLGVAKESARFILPLATQTTLYMTGSIRSWIHYLKLRNDSHAQKEHQLIAQDIERALRVYLPFTFQALDMIAAERAKWKRIIKILEDRGIDSDTALLEVLLTMPVKANESHGEAR